MEDSFFVWLWWYRKNFHVEDIVSCNKKQWDDCFKCSFKWHSSLLLPGGKIAHSTFCIPLLINEESTCNIAQGSLRAKLLIATSLII